MQITVVHNTAWRSFDNLLSCPPHRCWQLLGKGVRTSTLLKHCETTSASLGTTNGHHCCRKQRESTTATGKSTKYHNPLLASDVSYSSCPAWHEARPVSEMTYTVSSGMLNHSIPYHRGVYRGEVDATCVQIGLRGKRITPWRVKNSFSFCSQKVKQ